MGQIVCALVQQMHCRKSVLIDRRCCPEGMFLIKNGSIQVTDFTTDAQGKLEPGRPQLKYPGQSFADHSLFSETGGVPMEVSD